MYIRGFFGLRDHRHLLSKRAMRHPNGFSFAEVMFAVVILGIGFIMVAAIFPVAVEQTQATGDEAAASALARDVMKVIQSTTAGDYPNTVADTGKTAITEPFSSQPSLPPLWSQVSGQLISVTDPRYACVPFFCTSQDGTVQITLLIVRRWSYPAYTQTDIENDLIPRGISVDSITHGADGTDSIVIDKMTDRTGMYQSVAPGTFIIITNFGDGTPSGRTFRVASKKAETSESVTWTLDIANGLQPGESHNTGSPISAAVIGRDLGDPSSSAGIGNSFIGPSQDVAVYTTYVNP
jgi:Tfp pilus assembly protein PilV